MARPMPRPAPVITATFPSNRISAMVPVAPLLLLERSVIATLGIPFTVALELDRDLQILASEAERRVVVSADRRTSVLAAIQPGRNAVGRPGLRDVDGARDRIIDPERCAARVPAAASELDPDLDATGSLRQRRSDRVAHCFGVDVLVAHGVILEVKRESAEATAPGNDHSLGVR